MVWSLTRSQTGEYEVKWALGSNTTNKATGGDGIPVVGGGGLVTYV